MKVEIKIPQMGESVNEAVVGTILKASGSYVSMDEDILELETEKVNQVLTAPREGQLELNVKVDDVVKIGQVIGYVDTEAKKAEGAAVPQSPKPSAKEPEKAKAPAPAPLPAAKPAPQKDAGQPIRQTKEALIEELKAPKAAPKAAPTEAAAEPPKVNKDRETRQRMTTIRQVIARRLVEAQQTAAMLTTFNEIDMSRVMELRNQHREAFQKKFGVKLGFMSWFVKGCVAALKQLPALNSYIDGNEIVHREYYHIGIAVGTERGLVVPVVRECDTLSFADIERQIAGYAVKARDGTLAIDDLRGGGFTITNGGIYGSLLSTPILNAPQSGILGMHAIKERPIAINGQVVIRPMMYVALSYDHRIVDGEGAVTFLVQLKNYLENPSALLLEL